MPISRETSQINICTATHALSTRPNGWYPTAAKIITSRDLPIKVLFALQMPRPWAHEHDNQLRSLNSKS